jgi:hypothetical protein
MVGCTVSWVRATQHAYEGTDCAVSVEQTARAAAAQLGSTATLLQRIHASASSVSKQNSWSRRAYESTSPSTRLLAAPRPSRGCHTERVHRHRACTGKALQDCFANANVLSLHAVPTAAVGRTNIQMDRRLQNSGNEHAQTGHASIHRPAHVCCCTTRTSTLRLLWAALPSIAHATQGSQHVLLFV